MQCQNNKSLLCVMQINAATLVSEGLKHKSVIRSPPTELTLSEEPFVP